MLLHHVCIQTNNYKETIEFYQKLLDMEIIDETPDFHGRDYNSWLKRDGFMIELQTPKKGEQFAEIDTEHAGLSHMCFWVKDIEEEYKQLQQKGIKSFRLHDGKAIYEVCGGKLLKVVAPEGTVIEFRDKEGC